MSNVPAVRPPTKLDLFMGEVLTADNDNAVRQVLPRHIPVERFKRNLVNALMANPKLLDMPPSLVWREVAKAAQAGLLLDPMLGEAYLIEAWDGKLKRTVPQLRVGYKGMMKLARQSGEIAVMYTDVVYENDKTLVTGGLNKDLQHEINIHSDRGAVIGYYAVVKFSNGERDYEWMTQKQITAIRDRSDAWKAFMDRKIRSTPWSTDHDEMARKTVLRRLLKRLPQSPDLQIALRHEDEADQPTMVDITPPRPQREQMQQRAMEAAAASPPPDPEHDPVTGEVHLMPETDPHDFGDAVETVEIELPDGVALQAMSHPEPEGEPAPREALAHDRAFDNPHHGHEADPPIPDNLAPMPLIEKTGTWPEFTKQFRELMTQERHRLDMLWKTHAPLLGKLKAEDRLSYAHLAKHGETLRSGK